ncbi:MAG: right-handed parallel beta-helix repeat-containing protein, partial [Planctomycetota bacterium]
MRFALTVIALILISGFAFSDTFYVPDDFTSIQGAIDATVNGDTVVVRSGTYVENIDFKGKAITVKSEEGPDVTVIDGGNPVNPDFASVVIFSKGEDEDSVLEGFTLTNGGGTSPGGPPCSDGGGIYCNGSSPTIKKNVITGNTSFSGGGIYFNESSSIIADNTILGNWAYEGSGGGIHCYNSSPTITNNIIGGNHTKIWGFGGGIYCYNSFPVITNNTIAGNHVSVIEDLGAGGGIFCSASNPVIANNMIHNNKVSGSIAYGGGIYCLDSSPTITNNTVSENSVGQGHGGGIYCENSSPIITNTICWNNTGEEISGGTPLVTFSNVKGGWPGTGNIDADPLFTKPDTGDFHLNPHSPCIDAGDKNVPGLPDFDFEGDPRIIDGDGDGLEVVDMGADEACFLFVPSQYPTIQSAIDAISAETSVLVAPGTYFENIDFHGKAITVTSMKVHENTVIDGCQKGSVVTFQSKEGLGSVLEGFQIVNGCASKGGGIFCDGASPCIRNNYIQGNYALYGDGGGIHCLNADPLIEDNHIASNTADHRGGGILCNQSSPMIRNNKIDFNTAEHGGGISCLNADPLIEDNHIASNTADHEGGGILCDQFSHLILNNKIDFNTAEHGGGICCMESSPEMVNNTLCGNEAAAGGGIYCHLSSLKLQNNQVAFNKATTGGGACYVAASPVMVNNILYKNEAATGGGISSDMHSSPIMTNNTVYSNSASSTGGGLDCSSGSPVITNSIFWNNEAPTGSQICGEIPLVTYCDVQGGWPGSWNIDEDPLFVDPYNGDFHLSPDSPCLNVGYNHAPELPEEDFEGDPRVFVIVDMGVDETGLGGGATIRVPKDYPTIQSAINVSMEGNTVLVSPGTYFENIKFKGKAIVLKSEQGPTVTVINGVQSGPVVRFQNGEGPDSRLKGFTITNGKAETGGGILCNQSSPVISDNIIQGNLADFGGGIQCNESSPVISDNIIQGNSADSGGGIQCNESSPVISNNIIHENWAECGGGVCGAASSAPEISGNTISGNTATSAGGGIYCGTGSSKIKNNIIHENWAERGGGIYCTDSN